MSHTASFVKWFLSGFTGSNTRALNATITVNYRRIYQLNGASAKTNIRVIITPVNKTACASDAIGSAKKTLRSS